MLDPVVTARFVFEPGTFTSASSRRCTHRDYACTRTRVARATTLQYGLPERRIHAPQKPRGCGSYLKYSNGSLLPSEQYARALHAFGKTRGRSLGASRGRFRESRGPGLPVRDVPADR